MLLAADQLRHVPLREFMRLALVTKGHLLGDQLVSADVLQEAA